jgi:hypothetical protein
VLKTLERVSHQIGVEVEEGLFGGPDDPLRVLADRLAEAILAEQREHNLPLKSIRLAKADLPEDEVDQLEIGFYLKLACGPKEAFEWLRRLSAREHEIAVSLPEEECKLFNHTFRIGIEWEKHS